MQLSTSNWSPSDWEMFFNAIYFGLALIIWTFVFACYRPHGPKYNDLFWSIILIVGASMLFGLYSESIEVFYAMQGLKPEDEAVRKRLSENLSVLVLVVPGVMLAVAANLITQFLNSLPPFKFKSK